MRDWAGGPVDGGQGDGGVARHDDFVSLVDGLHFALHQVKPFFNPLAPDCAVDASHVAHDIGAAEVGGQPRQERVVAHPVGNVAAEPGDALGPHVVHAGHSHLVGHEGLPVAPVGMVLAAGFGVHVGVRGVPSTVEKLEYVSAVVGHAVAADGAGIGVAAGEAYLHHPQRTVGDRRHGLPLLQPPPSTWSGCPDRSRTACPAPGRPIPPAASDGA